MRHAFSLGSVLLMAGVALGGCLGDEGVLHETEPPMGPTSTSDEAPSSDQAQGPTPASGWTLDCSLGAYEPPPWEQGCVARISHTPRTKAEMWVGVNPTNPLNVVVATKDMNPESSDACAWNLLGVTHDGGRTWTEVTIGGKFADREPGSPFYGYACNSDPIFRFSASGDLHFGVLMGNLGPQQPGPWYTTLGVKVLLATSHDGGLTWPDVITFMEETATPTDYGRMAISPATGTILETVNGRLATAGAVCRVLSSRDGGQTAELPVVIPPPAGGYLTLCLGIGVSPGGTATVVYQSCPPSVQECLEGPGLTTYFARSTDDGGTFVDTNVGFTYSFVNGFANTQAPTGFGLEILYDLTDGPGRGTLWTIYHAYTGGGAKDGSDVYVRSSPDDGRTWSKSVRVNAENSHQQYMPNLAIAADGSLHAFYFDRRYDPDNELIDITHAVSLDYGATWTEERVTTKSWDGDLGLHQDGHRWIGDYIGVDAVGNDVWAGFPDASLGEEPSMAAAHVFRADPEAGSS